MLLELIQGQKLIVIVKVGVGWGEREDPESWFPELPGFHLAFSPNLSPLYNTRVNLFYISKLGVCDLNQRSLKGKFALMVSCPHVPGSMLCSPALTRSVEQIRESRGWVFMVKVKKVKRITPPPLPFYRGGN